MFGNFLDGLGNSFDKDKSKNIAQELSETEDEAGKLAKIKDYKLRREFLSRISKESMAKFDFYAVDMFLLGKSNSNWMHTLLQEDSFSFNQTMNENSNRVLLEDIEEGEF